MVSCNQQENVTSSNGTLLEMRNIMKSFSGVRMLDNVSSAVRPDKCAGLYGKNGAGKLTLMKVLSGARPYGTFEDEVLWEGKSLRMHPVRDGGRADIVITHQELVTVQQLPVTKSIFFDNEITKPGDRMGYDATHAKAEGFLVHPRLADTNVAVSVMDYDNDHQQPLETAKVLTKNACPLIPDELTSSLSVKEAEVSLSIVDDLERSGVACVYISHKLDRVKRVCDTITVIRDGKHTSTRPVVDMTINNIITMMAGREMTSLFPKVEHTVGGMMAEMHNAICWDVINSSRRCTNNVSFAVCRGEILGVAGFADAERMETALTLFDAHPGRPSTEIVVDGKPVKMTSPADAVAIGICFVLGDHKRHDTVPLMAVDEGTTLVTPARCVHGLCADKGVELTTVDHEIKRLRIKTTSPALAITSLSGGNQQKAVVMKMVLAIPKVPIFDEPTRGIDTGFEYDIYEMIAGPTISGVVIIMVLSEMPEILGMNDRILAMDEGQLCGGFVDQGLTQERTLAAAINAELDRQAT